jgi:ATP-dependent helicase Lhr and Lhr-like helicase
VSAFDRLHPAIQHHIVNTLGWSSLRPLQVAAIEPLLDGEHAVLVAPTAGGKTEAAFFPLVSRMLTEGWAGLGLLYVCPIRALINNLEIRLQHYGRLLGRRCAVWHGDIGDSARRQIVRDPPDCLLTTPESLEVMLVTRRAERHQLFGAARAVIVDELHAIADDDRGWHLLAVLERITRLAGRELQRVGLSATIGNPETLLSWLTGSRPGLRRVVAAGEAFPGVAELALDYVGTLENAATVVSRLHQSEKRLVFCDSRARVEDLSALLRAGGVETYVSHSSLSVDERRRAEEAFSSGHDCVIVATSTLELGIDVGDLDRVIQIDAPWTVAGVLQRLGRTGRRPGAKRNCLFLATSEDAFLRAAGLATLLAEGFVEPVSPPPEPYHILAQQIMALALQEGGIGAHDWRAWIGKVPAFARMSEVDTRSVFAYMAERGILYEDGGLFWLGLRGEEEFGRKHFMELFSSFVSEPLFAVRYGHSAVGQVHKVSFAQRTEEIPVLRLGGRSWLVTHVDWADRVAYVEPTELPGRSRWLGAGQPLHFALCRSIRRVLAGGDVNAEISRRAKERLAEIRAEYSWVTPDGTVVVRDSEGGGLWWTFAGSLANGAIASYLRERGVRVRSADNLSIGLESDEDAGRLREVVRAAPPDEIAEIRSPVSQDAIDGLKFTVCLPPEVARHVLEVRLTDGAGIRAVFSEPVRALP